MTDLLNYYQNDYHKTGYTMQSMASSDRVAYLKQFLKHYVPSGSRVLDVGCGDMYLASQMPEYEWVGIDVDLKTSNNKAIKHDLMSAPYPFTNHSFDAVVCSEVLEHVWDLRIVHKEVKRVLKSNGSYIMSTPNFDNIDHHRSNYKEILFDPRFSHLFEHIRFYNYETHKKFLEEAQFRLIEHVGADSHYVKFFVRPRSVLLTVLNQQLKLNLTSTQVDMIVGQMFPTQNHTIMIVSKS